MIALDMTIDATSPAYSPTLEFREEPTLPEKKEWAKFEEALNLAEENIRKKEVPPKEQFNFNSRIDHQSLIPREDFSEKNKHENLASKKLFNTPAPESSIEMPLSSSENIFSPASAQPKSFEKNKVQDWNVFYRYLKQESEGIKDSKSKQTLDWADFENWLNVAWKKISTLKLGKLDHLVFQLEPENMGQMNLVFSQDEGSLSIMIAANQTDTLDRIQKQLPDLLESLQKLTGNKKTIFLRTEKLTYTDEGKDNL